jgi:predicted alpha/beta hydrolase family esterase
MNCLARWIYAMTLEIFALLGVIFSALMILVPSYRKPAGRKGGKPILLAYGYLNHVGVWVLQRRWLAQKGFGPIYTVPLASPFSSIEKHAAKVKEEIEKRDLKKVTLVGYSMGGLACAYYATAHPERVEKVIVISAPFKGTVMALLAPGKNGAEMRPGSEFLRKLISHMKQSRVPFYFIESECDEIVQPNAAEVFDIPKGHLLVIRNLGHAGLIFSRRVNQRIEAVSPSIEI